MGLQFSLIFNGKCNEALTFYTKIFGMPMPEVMKYGDMPAEPGYTVSEEEKDYVMYSEINILGTNVMLSDWPNEMEPKLIAGNNAGLVVVLDDENEIKRLYDALNIDGKIEMELQKTSWSGAYAMFYDKFGVQWQLNLDCRR